MYNTVPRSQYWRGDGSLHVYMSLASTVDGVNSIAKLRMMQTIVQRV